MSRQGRKSANPTIFFFKPASLGIHRVQARDERSTEHQPEHPEMRDSGKSAPDGNITSALSQWPPGWYRLQEIASLLGETAAETKIALTKLKESIINE